MSRSVREKDTLTSVIGYLYPFLKVVKETDLTTPSLLIVHTMVHRGLEPLKIETRLINEMFSSVMGECDLDSTGTPSIFKIIRSVGSGKIHRSMTTAELLKMQKIGQFPDDLVKIKVSQIHYESSQTY
jgi:hypothetical protein